MKKNSFLFGSIIGLLAPSIAYFIMLLTPPLAITIGVRPLGLYAVSALINLLLVRFFYRNTLEKSAHGVVLITFAAALWLIFTQNLSLE
ncbi:hypothetical protein ACFOET_20540 [Parapedobacter deserti]|uniref:Uncharacterized protein n=1 Tax=Parapedobacter deserti TaxID=1912957 RepID=A0ABV7JTI5_9SPHI